MEKMFDAVITWRKHKNLTNLKRLVKDGFQGGRIYWRLWRILINSLSGRYRKIQEGYEEGKNGREKREL